MSQGPPFFRLCTRGCVGVVPHLVLQSAFEANAPRSSHPHGGLDSTGWQSLKHQPRPHLPQATAIASWHFVSLPAKGLWLEGSCVAVSDHVRSCACPHSLSMSCDPVQTLWWGLSNEP